MLTRRIRIGGLALSSAALVALAGCGDRLSACADCGGTVVVAAMGEPPFLLPPLIVETVGRDISDLVYERLADLAPGGSPVDPSAYRPRLATRWEQLDSVTWRFHLRPGARWHDGTAVAAEDVRFSFEAFADSVLDSPARPSLAGRVQIQVEDSATFQVRFAEPSPEQLFTATYHVRVIPKHVWAALPRDAWPADTALGRLIGSGPYRIHEWKRGRHLVLEANSTAARAGNVARVVWRFAADPDAALNLVLSGEADLLESVVTPGQRERVARDSTLELRAYPGATYGFLAFRVADDRGRPHSLLGDREVRRGLSLAIDRERLTHALFGAGASAPRGPISELLWIRDDSIAVLPYDTAAASRALDAAGWRRASHAGLRQRNGRQLRFDVLVPSSSRIRREAAVMLQEAWRQSGVAVSITSVDPPLFQERLRKGRFDSYIGAYLDEPSARGLADQWTRAGWKGLNFGHYANPAFDALFSEASRMADVRTARRLYREAMDTLNADAPALFLYAPSSLAAIRRRFETVEIDPYSWLSGLPEWRIRPSGTAPSLSAR